MSGVVNASSTTVIEVTNVQYNGDSVIVVGTVSGNSNNEVELRIVNSSEQIVQSLVIETDSEGKYGVEIPLDMSYADGDYKVQVFSPAEVSFSHKSTEEEKPDVEKPETNTPATITATLTQSDGKFNVSGNTTGGSDNEIILYVTDPKGETAYIDQTVSGEGGAFSFTFPLRNSVAEGTYMAIIRGTNVASPYILKFEKLSLDDGETPSPEEPEPEEPEPEEPTVYEITSDAVFDNSSMVVSGQIQPATQTDVRARIVDSALETVTEATFKTNELGEYNYVFDLKGKVSNGIYTVNIYAGESSSATNEVMVIVPCEKTDIDKRKNSRLYMALKESRRNLDSDNDGIITTSELSQISGTLNLSNNSITSIDGLQSCTSITELYINDNKISDLSAIAALDNLKTLVADNNNISEVKVLPRNLTYLNVSGNNIKDLYCLRFVNDIEYLFADRNRISDLSFSSEFENIKYLSMNRNSVVDISSLSKCKNLVYIDLSYNSISDIGSLNELYNLRDLRLSYNSITDISTLPDVVYRNLYVDNNDIALSDIEPYSAINKVYLP